MDYEQTNKISVSFEDGKYTIEQIGHGSVDFLRYGEPWVADAPGQKMLIKVAYEVHALRRLAAAMKLRNGEMTGAQFDTLVKELHDLNNPGTV